MEPKARGRKLVPMYKHENAWRHRQHVNSAKIKYTPDVLRTLYVAAECPLMPSYPDFPQLVSSDTLLPAIPIGESFSHNLGTELNSRKVVPRDRKQDLVPEWYTESAEPKPVVETKKPEVEVVKVEEAKPKEKIKVEISKNVKNFQPFDEEEGQFSRVDELYEIKLKQQAEEPEEAIPEWDDPVEEPVKSLPKYHSEIIKAQLIEGNPFSSILLDGVTMDEEGFICPTPNSKAYDKVWYYRDPQGDVQGAFDSVEMFNWYAAGYFTDELHVSYASRLQFVPLSYFINEQKQLLSNLLSQPEPPRDEATKEIKSMLGIKTTPWGNRQPAPVTSFVDIQRQQAMGKKT
eukprot:CAMPEP_0204916916 /NCGR_PEP_ID=MMETSP1397-20131031/14623_1 /ASSEMBLY_ACC=CAM_ASM_000891 /TAXON_ID=49980 /ORGANISM="Climacostomum Climacostomum virens, Strain Stock W-24" /LENGTH=345 /DNA_ID=CAMNT_0052089597 /DNA_START=138 /DNA_END=1175 /DNA_ORIENTATION=+